MNVMGAWEQGVTGKRVVVTILDDGIEKDHPDLMDNYVRTEREREREMYTVLLISKIIMFPSNSLN